MSRTGVVVIAMLPMLAVIAPAQAQRARGAPQREPAAIVRDSGPRPPVKPLESCTVDRIADGDTFECRGVGRIRLIGVDAPELNQKDVGAASRNALATLLPVGAKVLIERDVEMKDQYSRTLAYVWRDRRMVNWLLIRSGWTVQLTYPPNVRYVGAFGTAQREARTARLGLWATGGFDCLPVDHRKAKC